MEAHPVSFAIAAAVRGARRDGGLRQAELALAAGVSVRTVHSIEAGAAGIRLNKLLDVLTALGLTLEVTERPIRLSLRQYDDE